MARRVLPISCIVQKNLGKKAIVSLSKALVYVRMKSAISDSGEEGIHS